MRKNGSAALLGAVIAAISGTAMADHPTVGFGAGIAGPAITIPATTLSKGTAGIALRVEYLKFGAFSDAELVRFAGEGVDTHSVDYLLTPSLGVGYGLTDDLTLTARLPYIIRGNIRQAHDEDGEVEVHSHGDADGVGDLTFLGQYRFIANRQLGIECALLAGIKMPTGETGVTDKSGEVFETEHQPGSGSWDPLLGFAVTKHYGSLSLDGNVLYAFATRGAHETDLGDRLHYNAALSYRLGGDESADHHSHDTAVHAHLAWDLILELNGEWQEKQKIGALQDENSGGSLLFLTPGVRVCGEGNWGATLSAGVPVLEELNGVQHETDLRLMLSLSKGF